MVVHGVYGGSIWGVLWEHIESMTIIQGKYDERIWGVLVGAYREYGSNTRGVWWEHIESMAVIQGEYDGSIWGVWWEHIGSMEESYLWKASVHSCSSSKVSQRSSHTCDCYCD